MSDTMTYQYAAPSTLRRTADGDELFLAEYSEVRKKSCAPCFFWGRLTQPFLTARCLIALQSVVQSSFNLSPAERAKLRDPIVTAGDSRLRFEGFSHCAGVYARVDVLPDGHDGEFPDCGTTNVDFNPPMIAALGSVGRQERMVMSVGEREVGLYRDGGKVVERKVPLPVKWIKGLTTVQIYQSAAVCAHRFNRIQAMQLFRSLPRGNVKCDYWLTVRGGRPSFSPAASTGGVCVGGVHRLRLLEPLLPYADELHVFAHPQMQTTVWQLYFGTALRYSLSLSRECWRGFSGEGAALDSLIDDVPAAWVEATDRYSYANQTFNATLFAIEQGIDRSQTDSLTARLASMGLLGYDLDAGAFFYRRLPFRTERIMRLNPRMENAMKLLDEGRVEIVSRTATRVEAKVEGTGGVRHTVVLSDGHDRCTCQWFSANQGERGPCKHILAVRKSVGEE